MNTDGCSYRQATPDGGCRTRALFRPGRRTARARRAWGLLQMIGAIFAGSAVLSVTVPLFMAAQREAEVGAARARMTTEARELSGHIREDIRQASRVELAAGGTELRLVLTRASQPGVQDRITYRRTADGLQREVRPGDDARPAERRVYGPPLTQCQFVQDPGGVVARLSYVRRVSGRSVRYSLNCSAMPRSAL